MGRPRGSRNRLVTLDYDAIAEMAGGITGDTARRYAQRGEYDARDLDSLLAWINRRRAARGLALVGLPDGGAPAHSDDTPTPAESPKDIKPAVLAGGLLVYDPVAGRYRGPDGDESG